jgi:membrane protein DedA with SNARE-associated domain
VLVASVLSGLTHAITDVIGDYGLYAVFLLMLVDAVLPAASEPVMVYGGAVAAGAFAGQDVVLLGSEVPSGLPAYLAIALAGTVAYTIGSVGGWAIGLYGGRPFVERRGRWLHLNAKKLDRAERWFERYGDAFVFFGRVTPVLRSFVAIPAGIARMPLGRYTWLTLLGSAIWCFALAGIGWALGANWERFHHAFRYADYAIVVAVVVLVAVILLRWRSARARTRDRARVPVDGAGLDPAGASEVPDHRET